MTVNTTAYREFQGYLPVLRPIRYMALHDLWTNTKKYCTLNDTKHTVTDAKY